LGVALNGVPYVRRLPNRIFWKMRPHIITKIQSGAEKRAVGENSFCGRPKPERRKIMIAHK
jgi:hypothetical protein